MMVDELKPGLELDAAVAERVMGWPRKRRYDGRVYWLDPRGTMWLTLPWFSRSIASAWGVVGRLGANHIEIYIRKNDVVVWLGGPSFNGKHLGVGESEAHAISLAALEAMEAQCASES